MRHILYFCLIAMVATLFCSYGARVPADAPLITRQPNITPDYSDIVLPPNIAPLNFAIEEEGDEFAVGISGESGKSIMVSAKYGDVRIPEKTWRMILKHNRGKKLSIVVYVCIKGRWHRFKTIENSIAEEEIDSHLVYRWMRSLHHFNDQLSLIQRSLESFRENIVLDNRSIGGDCMNCHTFLNGRTSTMTYQVRSSKFGLPMILVKDGKATPVNTRTAGFSTSPASFSSWHPSGKLIAFSVNKVRPYEHTIGQTRGEWDNNSDLGIYHVDENRVSSTSGISNPARRESWPAWSADGKCLYFSSAPQLPITEYQNVRYDLMQIPFNPTSGAWGKPHVIVSSKQAAMSCVEPRVSPDGKWVLFCGCDYGHMACFLKSSDVHILNTKTGVHRKLEINSDLSESWPTWSSNGRWICFVSKRRNGLMSHIYFSYFDEDGKAHKPFILPQKDPRYYNSCALTYNKPELAVEPVNITESALAKGICRTKKIEPPKAFDRTDRNDTPQSPNQMERGGH